MSNLIKNLVNKFTKTYGEKCGDEMEEALEYLEGEYSEIYFDYYKKDNGTYSISISDDKDAAEGRPDLDDGYFLFMISSKGSGYISMEYWNDGFSGEPEREDVNVDDFSSDDLIDFVETRL